MKSKTKLFGALFALLSGLLAASVYKIGKLQMKIDDLEGRRESRAVESPAPESARESAAEDSAKPSEETELEDDGIPKELEIEEFRYDDKRSVYIFFNETPDMSSIRNFITAGPVYSGTPAISKIKTYRYSDWKLAEAIVVSADFLHRTNLTFRIRAGLPCAKAGTAPLKSDFTRELRREDEPASFGFRDGGRYLSPSGDRLVAIEAINVTNLIAETRQVPRANIIHMLALEENAYSKIWRTSWNRESFVSDLAGNSWASSVDFPAIPNVKQKASFSLSPLDGNVLNGTYLARLSNGDMERFKVVCVTDMALACRKTGDRVSAWITTLSGGTPVAGATVAVYSKANIMIARGTTDAQGWCECGKIEDGEPFAAVAWKEDGSDSVYVQFASSTEVSETFSDTYMPAHLEKGELAAFSWTDRGIYRHGEKIFVESIIRDFAGKTPGRIPVKIVLKRPDGDRFAELSLTTDESGRVSSDAFSVPDEQPSGTWTVETALPGEHGTRLCSRHVKIEDFAPPQIRVAVKPLPAAEAGTLPFEVTAEHLTGEPAEGLKCEASFMFADEPFAPAGWQGWKFGDDRRAAESSIVKLPSTALDKDGKAVFAAADRSLKPAAAVKACLQGVVFEDGGRPATSVKTATMHVYPYYIGAEMGDTLRADAAGDVQVRVSCVKSDGSPLGGKRSMKVRVEKLDSVYSYELGNDGFGSWNSSKCRQLVIDGADFETGGDGSGTLSLQLPDSGDYVLSLENAESSFSHGFYFSRYGDCDGVRAPLANPARVALAADKTLYRPGDTPRIAVRSPFAGTALVEVFRDRLLYARTVNLDSATCEIELDPVDSSCAPNLEVALTVVQGIEAGSGHLAFRAHGETCIKVRDAACEIPVAVKAAAARNSVEVEIDAPGAETVSVTLVDEGINLLTGEAVPDPVGELSRPRSGLKEKFDLFRRLLPIVGEDEMKIRGVKTGGDGFLGMMSRISPEPSRRFKPLALSQSALKVVDGKVKTVFDISGFSGFSGEVRVTAVAVSSGATGAAAEHLKIAPRLGIKPDAPRFASPGDVFRATLPVYNRSGADGDVSYSVSWAMRSVPEAAGSITGCVFVADGKKAIVPVDIKAPDAPGEMEITFAAEGLGEKQDSTIFLPVRPAAAWRQEGGTVVLDPGAAFDIPRPADGRPFQFAYCASSTRMGELKNALDWLAEYPHGCLEQTSSRIFPLITAGGILSSLGKGEKDDLGKFTVSGVRRVESMMRRRDFTMWPDCECPPWDREVSLYAAHFLVEAYASGIETKTACRDRVLGYLREWAESEDDNVAAYACHTLALAGHPDTAKMLVLFDKSDSLSLLSRARLARAFAVSGAAKKAAKLLEGAASPGSVKEAAFALLALLDVDADDPRIPPLVSYLVDKRDKSLYSWGTTESNAHALLALGAYYRAHPAKGGRCEVREAGGKLLNVGEGTAFVTWKSSTLPRPEEEKEVSGLLSVRRRFLTAEGKEYDTANAKRGDMVVVELTLKSSAARSYNDLVIQDLLPAGCETVTGGMGVESLPCARGLDDKWVMRSDKRDDRVLVYSKKFDMEKDGEVRFIYQTRVVSPGDYAVAGVSVEAMYDPALSARSLGGRFVVRD